MRIQKPGGTGQLLRVDLHPLTSQANQGCALLGQGLKFLHAQWLISHGNFPLIVDEALQPEQALTLAVTPAAGAPDVLQFRRIDKQPRPDLRRRITPPGGGDHAESRFLQNGFHIDEKFIRIAGRKRHTRGRRFGEHGFDLRIHATGSSEFGEQDILRFVRAHSLGSEPPLLVPDLLRVDEDPGIILRLQVERQAPDHVIRNGLQFAEREGFHRLTEFKTQMQGKILPALIESADPSLHVMNHGLSDF